MSPFTQELVRVMERDVPGLSHRTYPWPDDDVVVLSYKCPCGEISQMALRTDAYLPVEAAEYVAERQKEELRRHVRSEGNEPNF